MLARADYSDIAAISQKMVEASEAIAALVERTAAARQVREYDSERRRGALSRAVVPFLDQGESATAAEHKARASTGYSAAMRLLGCQLQVAEEVMAEYDSHKIRFECARSLLSIQKSLVTNL